MADIETPTTEAAESTTPDIDSEWLVNQIAHALRNPIFAVVMQAESAAMVAGDPERLQRTLRSLEQQVQRLQRTIDEMLLYGRPARIARERVVVAELLREVVSQWQHASDGGGRRAPELRLDPDLGEARWDRRAVQQILERLLDNADQHTPPPRSFSLEAFPAGETAVVLKVRDQGEGIDDFLRTLSDRLRAIARVVELVVPYERGDVLAAIHREGEVVGITHADDGQHVRARLSDASVGRLSEFVVSAAPVE